MSPKDPPQQPELKKTWVVLAAHGSPSHPPGSKGDGFVDTRPTACLARAVEKLKVFAGVSYGFLETAPSLADSIDKAESADIVIVPNLACEGHVATTKLPRALSLTGKRTERIGPKGRQSLYLSPPVGTSDTIPVLAANLFRGAMSVAEKRANQKTGGKANFNKTNTTAVIVGHGSGQGRASFEQTNEIARRVALEGLRVPVQALFLDEPPTVAEWAKAISSANSNTGGGENIFFMPVMVSDGHHGTVDIPKAMGLDPESAPFQSQLADDGLVGPVTLQGYTVYFMAPLGMSTDDLAHMVVELAKSALIGATGD